MKKELFKYFCCPVCRKELCLDLRERGYSADKTGCEVLKCRGCGKTFPMVNFLPRFVESEDYCRSFGFEWNRHRRVQLDKFNGYKFSHNRLFNVTGWPKRNKDEFILEAGSGAGRFTEVLVETGARVFSFDYSRAIDANLANNGLPENLCLFQADICHLPLYYGLFDKILCLGVLQHTPDPKRAFMSLIPFLKKGGEIVIDVYKKTVFSMAQWKYVLRPLLRHMKQERLYGYIRKIVPALLPAAATLRKIGGSICGRILPIANYSHLGIMYEMNRELSILDTFDMYSPKYDKPQTLRQVRRWFEEAGLRDIKVRYGPNGIIGRGIKY